MECTRTTISKTSLRHIVCVALLEFKRNAERLRSSNEPGSENRAKVFDGYASGALEIVRKINFANEIEFVF